MKNGIKIKRAIMKLNETMVECGFEPLNAVGLGQAGNCFDSVKLGEDIPDIGINDFNPEEVHEFEVKTIWLEFYKPGTYCKE